MNGVVPKLSVEDNATPDARPLPEPESQVPPFTDDPAKSDLFLKKYNARNVALEDLLCAVRERVGLVALIADSEAEKNRILDKLIQNAPANIQFICSPSGSATFDELLSIICAALNLTVPDPTRRHKLKVLKDYLSDKNYPGRMVTLVIDNAHLLQNNVLSYLLMFTHAGLIRKNALQLLLRGTAELEKQLERQRAIYSNLKDIRMMYLSRLADFDTANNAQYPFKAAGRKQRLLFPPATMERVAYHAGGDADNVNKLCRHALRVAQERNERYVSPSLIDELAKTYREQPPQKQSQAGAGRSTAESTADPIASSSHPIPAAVGKKQVSFSLSWPTSTLILMIALVTGIVSAASVILLYEKKNSDNLLAKQSVPVLPDSDRAPDAIVEKRSAGKLKSPVAVQPADDAPPKTMPAEQRQTVVASEIKSVVATPVATQPATQSNAASEPVAPKPTPEHDPQQVAFYVQRAKEMLELGDVTSARLFFQACVETGDPECMIAVGATYDPQQLKKQDLSGVHADLTQAMDWYQRALQTGEAQATTQAKEKMKSLRAWLTKSAGQ